MSDPNKRIHNPLFNPNVTGGGYEEFSQHAVLFPAEEVTHPVDFNTPEFNLQPAGTSVQAPSAFLPPQNQQQSTQIPISYDIGNQSVAYQQEDFDISSQPQWSNQSLDLNPANRLEEGPSQISSLISSFSNIWKRSTDSLPSSSSFQPQEDTVGVAPYFAPNPIAPAVPLFSPYDAALAQTNRPPPSSTATTNTYRRVGSKRPVYAPIPGLSGTSQPTPLKEPQRPPGSHSPYSQSPSISPQPSFGTTTPKHFTPFAKHNLFENTIVPPIPFTPPSPKALNLIAESSRVSNPELFTPSTPQSNTIQTNSPFLSPVDDFNYLSNAPELTSITPIMSAIPANDMESAGNLPYGYARSDGVSAMTANATYRPVYHHWFYRKNSETRAAWQAFSMFDSLELENAFTSPDLSPEKVVATDGGRYDVNILRRQRMAVYWKSEPTEVRRCSWFHRVSADGKFVPFEENIATKLEDEYKAAFEINEWHTKVELNNGEIVNFHGPDVLVLLPPAQSPDAWGNTPPGQPKPRVVKRGLDEFDIDEGESTNIDHLLFMVHGIGSVCDLKFRSVEEVVDDFRNIALQLVRSHYRSSCEKGVSHRVEVLPISWHDELHTDTGIDKKLKGITLESIPKLRNFTNDTLLDILFYTSPVYCQTIVSTVGNELNRIYDLFKQRNPKFNGGISLSGHSLGSLILFDILCHQHPEPGKDDTANDSGEDVVTPLQEPKPPHPRHRRMSRRISYMMGSVGTGQPQITYPHLTFQPVTFFALGSPIGMFVTIRGLDTLGDQFVLPTCQGFFNIFHPYDPVAYRIESLVNPELSAVKPVLIPHHKGRKRMHLELKETMSRVGADLKHKVFDSMKSTWNSLFQLGFFKQQQPGFQAEVNKVLEEELAKEQLKTEQIEDVQAEVTDLSLGILNKGRRIDYVLQEAPFEFFNEYIFALTSHVCYWESEDTILLMLKEIYDSMDVSPDCQIPQQSMTIERPPPSPVSSRAAFGVDPTMPMSSNTNLGPPPIAGFVKKT